MRRSQSVSLVVTGLLCLVGGTALGAGGSESKVKVNVTAEKPDANGKQVIVIELDIEKGWHAYANPVGNDMFATGVTKVEIAGQPDAKIDYPKGKLVTDKDAGSYFAYEGKVQIKATVNRGKNPEPLTVKIRFQTCDDNTCLPAARIEKKVE